MPYHCRAARWFSCSARPVLGLAVTTCPCFSFPPAEVGDKRRGKVHKHSDDAQFLSSMLCASAYYSAIRGMSDF
jgi:hypothetical protein